MDSDEENRQRQLDEEQQREKKMSQGKKKKNGRVKYFALDKRLELKIATLRKRQICLIVINVR